MFLQRGLVFTHEAVREWEAKVAPMISDALRERLRGVVCESWYVVIAAALVAMLPRVELNDQSVECFDHRVTFRTDTDYALDYIPGIYPVEFSVSAQGPQGMNDPEYLNNLEQFADWLRARPDVEQGGLRVKSCPLHKI